MKHYVSTFAILAVSVLGALAPDVKADEWNKQTNITINQTVEVQGAVLPAGSYVLELADLPSNRHVVRIFNADDNHLIATLFTISASRLEPTGKSVFKFDSENDRAPELRTWFYPGDTIGFEFKASSGPRAAEVAKGGNPTTASAAGN